MPSTAAPSAPRSRAAVAGTGLGSRIPALDGLRGIAILLVLLLHFRMAVEPTAAIDALYLSAVRLGWVGVDLFFVLSGFLITGILYDAKGGEGYFRNFYMRRVLRIFPLYYGFLVVLFLILPALVPDGVLDAPLSKQLWAWSYTTNFQLAITDDWNAPAGNTGHFWSLAVEEQFYLVWPLLVFLASRRQLIAMCVLLIFAAVGVRIVGQYVLENNSFGYVMMPARMDALAAGGLVAMIAREPGGFPWLKRWAPPLLAVSAAGIAFLIAWRAGFSTWDRVVQIVGYSLVAAFFAALLVIAVGAPAESRAGRFFSAPWLQFFGRYSYAMYVLHLPLVVLLRAFVFDVSDVPTVRGSYMPGQLLFLAVATAATVGAALASWHLWEKHFLKLKDRFPYAPVRGPGRRRPSLTPGGRLAGTKASPTAHCRAREGGC